LVNYHYSYLVGTLIFSAAWVVCYVVRKKYQPQIIWGSLVSAPLALTSILFVPQYWTPPSLFDLDMRFRVGIEDVLWAAAVGGIASVIGEILLKERLAVRRKQPHKRHLAPFVLMFLLGVILYLWHVKIIQIAIISFTVCALVIAVLRRDLILTMLVGAFNFTLLYFLLFFYFLQLYPDFVQRYYNVPNLLGVYILRVPIEELLFAASGGTVWSVAYEYVQGYRLSPGRPFRLVQV
jgi:hypothetical protein